MEGEMGPVVSRRNLMVGAGAAALCAGLPAKASGSGAADNELHALLTQQFEALLRRAPALASALGIDTGERAALRSQWPDWSPAGRDRARVQGRDELRVL